MDLKHDIPYNHHPVDDMEPEILKTDAIAELSERLTFMFAWVIDARDSKAVAARVWVAAHYFCPSLVNSEALTDTGMRLGVTRQAISKLLVDLRDMVSTIAGEGEQKMVHSKRHEHRLIYQKAQYERNHTNSRDHADSEHSGGNGQSDGEAGKQGQGV